MFLSDTKIKKNIKLPWNNKSKDESYQEYIEQWQKLNKSNFSASMKQISVCLVILSVLIETLGRPYFIHLQKYYTYNDQ